MANRKISYLFEKNTIKKKEEQVPSQVQSLEKTESLSLPIWNESTPLSDIIPFPEDRVVPFLDELPEQTSQTVAILDKFPDIEPAEKDPELDLLYQKYQKLQLHYSVCQILLKVGLALNAQLHEIARLLCNQFGLWQCHVFLQDDDEPADLICSASHNSKQKNINTIQVDWLIRVGQEDPLGQAIYQKRDILTTHHDYNRYCLPIYHQQDVWGVIDLYYTPDNQPGVQEQLSLKTIASQLSSYLEEYKRYQLAQQMAITDGLTHVYNHRHFQESLDHAIRHANKKKEWLSLIMLDIDFFKLINDEFGHLQGDKVLSQVAHIIKKTIRQADFPARYGGEEFAILLKNTDLHIAKQVAERLRSNIENEEMFDDLGRQIKITASLGIAGFLSPELCMKSKLLSLADAALYQVKENGRNGVIVHESVLHVDEATPEETEVFELVAQKTDDSNPTNWSDYLYENKELIKQQWLNSIEEYKDKNVSQVTQYLLPVFHSVISRISQSLERNKILPILELIDKLPKPPAIDAMSFEVSGMLLHDAFRDTFIQEELETSEVKHFLKVVQENIEYLIEGLIKF